jgi:hypothetical protein
MDNGAKPTIHKNQHPENPKSSMFLVNYNDLTATSLEFWLIRDIIPKWPYSNSG